ncbi:membrane bound O-acyl transferase, MBOAT family protein [Desulfovibrio ferrophilus]|uniref:Membrane bound O-acyl transferase, MBOAT family protein n=2 Tax=Desulfovibrio ferrophilus TaxID=241368 RepID=A0A2Z6AWF6_9BACT|nr:membrane bound O-acyl transferase, MBOAT family protein [Desulfovibrio ferrophilus]
MLFNSYIFIFLFLPITFAVYFLLGGNRHAQTAKAWLVVASLFFYGWWNPSYLGLILGSLLFNFTAGSILTRGRGVAGLSCKAFMLVAVAANIALLGYFKYTDFLIANSNQLLGTSIPLQNIVLPLALSFFTFQQIAYIVDSHRGLTREYDFLNYALFVTFFPQLIAGPIVHHSEMMPQFSKARNMVLSQRNIAAGLFLFAIGLFKKTVLADTFGVWSTFGFDELQVLSFFRAWGTSLSYTMQLYFDFSGYVDMATGAALLFNIRLPMNFNSPYRALDIQDFWRRWHITLSRFLRDYIYIPLGGNRKGSLRVAANIMTTFLIGGLWHGAGWTFVFWGGLHGAALIVHRLWKMTGQTLPRWAAWFVTFHFVNVAWVFFRATTWDDAMKVLSGMCGFNGVTVYRSLYRVAEVLPFVTNSGEPLVVLGQFWVAAIGAITLIAWRDSLELRRSFRPNRRYTTLTSVCAVSALLTMQTAVSEFLYFNF